MTQKQIKVGGGENPAAAKARAILGNQGAGSAAQRAKDVLASLDKAVEAEKVKPAPVRRACCGCCTTDD